MADWILEDLIEALGRAQPTLEVERTSKGGVRVRWARRRAELKPEEVQAFESEEIDRRARGEESFLDLATGTLSVFRRDWATNIKVGPAPRRGLTPYQGALLARLLTFKPDIVTGWLGVPQVELARSLREVLDLKREISPLALGRFLRTARTLGVLERQNGTEVLDMRRALIVLRDQFRLSAIGQAKLYSGESSETSSWMSEVIPDRYCTGVSDALLIDSGAWIEPFDYLVDPSATPMVREWLGPPVKQGYDGPAVLIRPARRAPVDLLMLKPQPILNPVLAMVEGLRSDNPIAREAAQKLWAKWKRSE